MTEKVEFFDKRRWNGPRAGSDIPLGSDTDGDGIRNPSTCTPCVDEDVEEVRKKVDKMRRKRRLENAAIGLELVLIGAALCSSFYVLGKAVGVKTGYSSGFEDGLVFGERNVLKEYVKSRVWKVS